MQLLAEKCRNGQVTYATHVLHLADVPWQLQAHALKAGQEEAASPESSLFLRKVALRETGGGGMERGRGREGRREREGETAVTLPTAEQVSSVPPSSTYFSTVECLLLLTAISTSSTPSTTFRHSFSVSLSSVDLPVLLHVRVVDLCGHSQ